MACRQTGSVRGQTRAMVIFREKNVKRSSHFETHTRKLCDGIELGKGKGRGDGSSDVSPPCGSGRLCLGVRGVPAGQSSPNWIVGTLVCLPTFALTCHSRGLLPSESQAETDTWLPQVDRIYTGGFQIARGSWLFRALLSGCNYTELSLKAFLNLEIFSM